VPAPKKAPSPPATTPALPTQQSESDPVHHTGGTSSDQDVAHTDREKHRVAFDLGQCFLHHKYNYRGVIIGFDPTCQQSESWIRAMSVDSLKYGRDQPFYHVVPDTRDRPGAQITYVAQENIVIDTPPEPLQHPIINEMFSNFDATLGRYQPSAELRAKYPSRTAKPDPPESIESN